MPKTTQKMVGIDPEILIDHALLMTNGNQAELGRALGGGPRMVHEWKRNSDYLPPLYAHRFAKVFAHRLEEQQKIIQQTIGDHS